MLPPAFHYSSMGDPDLIIKMGMEHDAWQRDYKRLGDGRWLSLHFDAGGFMLDVLPDFEAVLADIGKARLTDGTLITFLKEHEAQLRGLFDISDDMTVYYVEEDDYYYRPHFQGFEFSFESTKKQEEGDNQ